VRPFGCATVHLDADLGQHAVTAWQMPSSLCSGRWAVERNLEAIGVAGVGQQRLGLLEIDLGQGSSSLV